MGTKVGVGEGVAVGEAVGAGVDVVVGVRVGAGVGEGVMVAVGGDVDVGVGVGVSGGVVGVEPQADNSNTITARISRITFIANHLCVLAHPGGCGFPEANHDVEGFR